MRFGPIVTQKNWPQDTLQVPMAGGKHSMPPVEYANQVVNGREAFTNSSVITWGPGLPIGTVFSDVIETDQDGDFWAANLYVTGFVFNAGPTANIVPPGMLQVIDLRTGKRLCYPAGVPLDFLTKRYDDNTANPDTLVPPSSWRGTTTLPEAFCFTRGGGIALEVTLTSTSFAAGGTELHIAFGGWKEYAHASGL